MSDGTMNELVDFEALKKDKERELEEKNALLEQKKEEEYVRFEQQIARDLYDREDVRKAGQEALSKVSALLIRYNRLQDAKKRRENEFAVNVADARKALDETLEDIAKKKAEVGKLIDKDKEEALKQLASDENDAKLLFEKQVVKARKDAMEDYTISLDKTIDSDEGGGILSTLMLGGATAGSLGYTLTSGDVADLMKGGTYISDMTKKGGTFLSQMALLDNAVNTGGIDLQKKDDESQKETDANRTDEDSFVGSSLKGAQYSLGDILRNISDQDVSEMNYYSGEKLSVDMGSIKSARESGDLDQEIGVQKGKKSILEAFSERGISDEARARMSGKKGGANDLKNKEKNYLKASTKPVTQVPGFFRSVFKRKPDYMYARKGAARRRALREEREAWEAAASKVMNRTKNPGMTFEQNENDTAQNTFAEFEKIQKKTDASDSQEKKALEELYGDKDKSARNMIAAYRLLGASPQELHMFRLALIAYMVPTGKKTLTQILRESEEGGYKGNEDLSSPEQMYATFTEEPVVDGAYVNRYVKDKKGTNEKEKIKSMNRADKEKMQNALSFQEEKEKSEEKKAEAKKKLQEKWLPPETKQIAEEAEEEEKEKEEKKQKTVLEKALVQHFKIVGKNQPEEELLKSFIEIFAKDQQQEQFKNVLLPQELAEIKKRLEEDPNYKKEIRQTILKLLSE